MAFNERLEIVELNAANEAVSLLNLNDGVHYMMEAGTFEPLPPEPTAVLAEDQRRWGGARQVGEVHATNGSIEWVAGVTATTEQQALEKVETLLAQLAANPFHAFVLWEVPGASHPTLYEMRGTGTWQPKYNIATFEGAQLFLFQVHLPVAPLAQGLPVKVYEKAGVILPETISLSAIPGDAPALAEVSIETGEGSNPSFITGASGPWGVATDATFIYWSNESSGHIGRAKLNGTEVNQSFITGCSSPKGVTVDGSHVYWCNSGTGDIGRAAIGGGTVEQAWITGGSTPYGIAVNGLNVFWCNAGTAKIGRAAIGGGTVEQSWISATGQTLRGLAVNASYVFWANLAGGNIIRAPIGGGTGTAFITGASAPSGVAVGPAHIFWSSEGTHQIGRANLAGGEVNQAYAVLESGVRSIAIQSQELDLYWANSPSGEIGRLTQTQPPIFALLGWAVAPTSGLAPAPFGLLPASACQASGTGWASLGTVEGGFGKAQHGDGTQAAAYWEVDPATMVPDSFSGEIAVEVWARILSKKLVGPVNLTLSAQPQDGVGFGAPRYTDEWGSAGRPFVPVEGETGSEWPWRLTRLGTLHLLVNPLAPRVWYLWLEGECESAYEWGVNYLICVPSLQRACSPSSKENNAAYPRFMANVGPTVKTVRSNLSALISKPGKNGHPDHGLGGELLQLPPGETDMLIKLSSLVPDSPAVNGNSEQVSYEAKITVNVTPRFFLARTV